MNSDVFFAFSAMPVLFSQVGADALSPPIFAAQSSDAEPAFVLHCNRSPRAVQVRKTGSRLRCGAPCRAVQP